jgi:hypothetical protein
LAREFDPNRLSFDEGLERIQQAIGKTALTRQGRILNSRDDGVKGALKALAVNNVPDGFRKWQLPVYLNAPSQLFVTVAEPGARAEAHSHREGDGFRFVAGGSIIYEGQELTAGD